MRKTHRSSHQQRLEKHKYGKVSFRSIFIEKKIQSQLTVLLVVNNGFAAWQKKNDGINATNDSHRAKVLFKPYIITEQSLKLNSLFTASIKKKAVYVAVAFI